MNWVWCMPMRMWEFQVSSSSLNTDNTILKRTFISLHAKNTFRSSFWDTGFELYSHDVFPMYFVKVIWYVRTLCEKFFYESFHYIIVQVISSSPFSSIQEKINIYYILRYRIDALQHGPQTEQMAHFTLHWSCEIIVQFLHKNLSMFITLKYHHFWPILKATMT